jgi:formate/nitrite transporter FocA (FNT family)
MGFEHSVANMYFIPAGILAATDTHLLANAGGLNLEQLGLNGFLWNNLLPVTLGNMIGGSVFVGLFYWFIYLRAK